MWPQEEFQVQKVQIRAKLESETKKLGRSLQSIRGPAINTEATSTEAGGESDAAARNAETLRQAGEARRAAADAAQAQYAEKMRSEVRLHTSLCSSHSGRCRHLSPSLSLFCVLIYRFGCLFGSKRRRGSDARKRRATKPRPTSRRSSGSTSRSRDSAMRMPEPARTQRLQTSSSSSPQERKSSEIAFIFSCRFSISTIKRSRAGSLRRAVVRLASHSSLPHALAAALYFFLGFGAGKAN